MRPEDFRYIRYSDGSEELYDHKWDPNEWMNLANDPSYIDVIDERSEMVPELNTPDIAN